MNNFKIELNNKEKINFDYAFNRLLGIEQGYVNDPDDNGGETNYGITHTLAKKYNINVKEITIEQAKFIYYTEFWKPMNLKRLKNKLLAYELFEFAVNTGLLTTSVKNLQRSYNLLNKKFILKEDGILGPKTSLFVNNYKFYKSLYRALNILQGMFYIGLAEGDKELLKNIKEHTETKGIDKYKKFIRGWIDKRVTL